jgi:hypothetical protein
MCLLKQLLNHQRLGIQRYKEKETTMIESILTIIALLLSGAVVGVGVIVAVLWFSVEKD